MMRMVNTFILLVVKPTDALFEDIYSSPYSHRDLPGGLNLRLEILQGSWERCSRRIQVRSFSASVLAS